MFALESEFTLLLSKFSLLLCVTNQLVKIIPYLETGVEIIKFPQGCAIH